MKPEALTPILIVKDVNATITFYENFLGFEKVMTVPESGDVVWAMLKNENVSIQVQAIDSVDLPGWQVRGGAIFYFNIKDLMVFFKKIKNAGIKIIMEPKKQFYGATEFTIEDCNGYVLIFAEDI